MKLSENAISVFNYIKHNWVNGTFMNADTIDIKITYNELLNALEELATNNLIKISHSIDTPLIITYVKQD